MTDDITLLPCPCCGAPAVTGADAEYENSNGEPAVECSSCNVMSWTVEDWNRRAAVEADRQQRHLKERAQLDAEWVALRHMRHMESQPAESAEPDNETALALADAPRSLRDYVAALRAAPVAQEPMQSDSFSSCAIGDSNYAAGMLLGWNLCVEGNEEKFNQTREARLRAAAQASQAAKAQDGAPVAAQAPRQPDAQTLIAYAEGRIDHARDGLCPDEIEGHDARDPDCPVCRALVEAVCRKCGARGGVSLTSDMQRESQRGAESGRDREDTR